MSVVTGVRACRSFRERAATRSSGFTLIELMIVVAIIGVMTSIAFPNYRNFRFRASRTEGMLGLKGLHIAQTSYYAEVGRYGSSFDEIGFEVLGGVRVDPKTIDGPFYRFEMDTYPYKGAPDGNFWATATGDLMVEDPILDVLLLENHVIIKE